MSFIGEVAVPPSADKFSEILKRETMNQVALLQSLSQGDFMGSVTVKELKTMGDTGVGTFDKLDGELIMFEGVVYKAQGNGDVVIASDGECVPFADVTYMVPDVVFQVDAPCNFKGLTEQFDDKIFHVGPNMFYMATVKCKLASLRVRAPYLYDDDAEPTLAEHMKDAERVYDHENVEGNLIALYCPPFMAGLNMPGWHLHFISDDGTVGGHVLEFEISEGKAAMDQTRCFNMVLPDRDARFMDMDLTLDQSKDLEAVEANKD